MLLIKVFLRKREASKRRVSSERLPIGSAALVGVNSDNVFAIMHNLGVQLGDSINPCELGSNCVPCLRNTCFPAEFDNLWILRLKEQQGETELTWLRYGRQKKE